MSLPVILRSDADTDIQTTHDELEQCRAGLGVQAAFVLTLDKIG
jgi:hypothetical protein